MKVGIIGAGSVGKACAFATLLRGAAREVILIDKIPELAKAVATDMQYGGILFSRTNIRQGDYSDLEDASIVMVTAGINEKAGGATDRADPAGRLKLLGMNAEIYKDIIPRITKAAPHALILVVTDPPDPLADVARQVSGSAKILSTGTYLDSLRFQYHLAQYFKVNSADVHAYVIGEHGTSSVFLWSSATIGGQPLTALLGTDFTKVKQQIEQEVRFANITIIEGNNASQYGIGMVCARIAELIMRNEAAVIPIGSYQEEYKITFSLPSVVTAQGVRQLFKPLMSVEEEESLQRCIAVLKKYSY